MAKIKVNYSSGRYKLVRPSGYPVGSDLDKNSPEKVERIYLTKTQARVLMRDSLYNRLGFKSIELEEKIED